MFRAVQMITVQDWDDLVKETYGKPYSFQQQDGCKERGVHYLLVPAEYVEDYENSSVPEIINHEEMGVSFKAWLERPIGNMPRIWWERNFYPSIEKIAEDLFDKGLLPDGECGIDINW